MSYQPKFQLETTNQIYPVPYSFNNYFQNVTHPNLAPNKTKFEQDKILSESLIYANKNDEYENIGFDLSLLKREDLHVNLIHFDLNIKNKENYEYYNKFKVDIIGEYVAIDSLDMLIKYLEAIKIKNIPFIVLSSGSSGKNVIPICRKYTFIKEVIIFCGNPNNYQYYLGQYPGYVKQIFIDIKQIYNYIKYLGLTYEQGVKEFKKSHYFIFSYDDFKMNKQLEQCPVISAYEYDNCYFLIHRAYAHFFGDINDKKNVIFTKSSFNKIQDYINSSDIIKEAEKQELIQQFKSLVDKENFVELSIRIYTGKSSFCYIFNRSMRNFEKSLFSLAYYMGPFLFALNKYVIDNPFFSFNQNMTLYKNIQCSIFDFYFYEMNLNHIICFPSITSTSLVPKIFKLGQNEKKYYNNGINHEDMLNVTMIFNYYHEKGNISPGIIVKDNIAKDGKYMSSNKDENEVIIFPFTFAKITKIKKINAKECEIYFHIINRKSYIEYYLKNNIEKRIKFYS